jgi:putative DNA primase/helicase
MCNDDQELETALQADVEGLAKALLGDPNKRLSKRVEMRWGAKGSVSMSLQGPKRGAWFDHEAGYGGGPLQLIVHVRRCSYDDAKVWAENWLRMPAGAPTRKDAAHPAAEMLAATDAEIAKRAGIAPMSVDADADEAKRIAMARRMWAPSVPLAGTLGEQYLIERRGIPRPAEGWPDCVRYHAGTRALIVAATTVDGTVQAVQRVLLTADGAKVSREAAVRLSPPTNKITNGVLSGAAIRLPALVPDAPLLLAEGPETGLSVWAATGAETWIALGSMTGLDLPAGRRMVACRDDDVRYSDAERSIKKALRAWRKSGLDIVGVTPWRVRRFDKSDFNDAIQQEGLGAVRDGIALALNPHCGTDGRGPKENLADVRKGLALGSCYLFAIASEVPQDYWIEPFTIGCRVDVGVGKSVIARSAAAEALALLRQREDNRTVAIAVPTHKLGDEQALAFNALPRSRKVGLDAAVWRGREAADPHAAGETMCLDLPAARDAISAGMDVQKAACRRVITGVSDIKCQFHDQCGYQRQRRQKADLWLVPHEMIFLEKPDAIGDLAALVVDESVWAAGLEGTGSQPITLALDTLDADCSVPFSPRATARLRFLRRTVLDTLRNLPNGPMQRDAMLATGLTPTSAAEARGLEWRRKIDVGMVPGMAADDRRKAAEAGAGNLAIRKLAMMWDAIGALLADDGPEASGWARLDDAASEHGTVRVIVLKGRKPVREGWKVPTLLIDANLDPDLIRPWWPFYLTCADLSVLTPHQRTRQVVDRAYSKRHLGQSDTANATEIKSGQRHMRDVAAILDREARQSPSGGTLIIANKAVEDALPMVWKMPSGVGTAHFNDIAGRDGWRSVGSLITIGSTNPPPAAVERLAEALTGEHVPPLPGWYERHTVTRDTTDGPVQTEAERHPHPTAEAIRWQIKEGEVVQAIGRARGVNRTAAVPVEVLILGDAVLPIQVEAVDAADLDPSPIELMLAAGGIGMESPTHAAICYPDLWASPHAAKKAFQRDQTGTNPERKYIFRECPRLLSRITYQLAGERQKPAIAWADLARVPDPAAWLEARLRPLAKCGVTPPKGPYSSELAA